MDLKRELVRLLKDHAIDIAEAAYNIALETYEDNKKRKENKN